MSIFMHLKRLKEVRENFVREKEMQAGYQVIKNGDNALFQVDFELYLLHFHRL